MGETSVFNEVDDNNRNLLLVQDATLTTPGTLQSISFFVDHAAGAMRLGLYDSTGPSGGPGKLIVQTASFTPVAGWNTKTLTATPLAAGTYWLAYAPNSNSLTFRVERDHGTTTWANRAYSAMPATFPTRVGTDQSHWSFYATLSVP